MNRLNDEENMRIIEELAATNRLLTDLHRGGKLGHPLCAGRFFVIRALGRRLPQAAGVS